MRTFEKLPATKPDTLGLPEACLAITDTALIFDNLRGTVTVVAAAEVDPNANDGAADAAGRAYDDVACARIDDVLARLNRPTLSLRTLDPARR